MPLPVVGGSHILPSVAPLQDGCSSCNDSAMFDTFWSSMMTRKYQTSQVVAGVKSHSKKMNSNPNCAPATACDVAVHRFGPKAPVH